MKTSTVIIEGKALQQLVPSFGIVYTMEMAEFNSQLLSLSR